MTFRWLKLITVILNFQYFRREPQSKCRILKGVCVYFESYVWKTFILQSYHLFFSLTLLKRITDTFKCLALPKSITNWYISLLQVEVLLLKALFCKQKLGKLQPKKKKKMQEHLLVYFNRPWQKKASSADTCGLSVVM